MFFSPEDVLENEVLLTKEDFSSEPVDKNLCCEASMEGPDRGLLQACDAILDEVESKLTWNLGNNQCYKLVINTVTYEDKDSKTIYSE